MLAEAARFLTTGTAVRYAICLVVEAISVSATGSIISIQFNGDGGSCLVRPMASRWYIVAKCVAVSRFAHCLCNGSTEYGSPVNTVTMGVR
jgi:hypothetical protein